MMDKIEQFSDSLKAETRLLTDRAVAKLRTAGLETAGLITRTKGPVHTLADSTLKLNSLSHKRVEQLLKQQVKMIDELIDGSAERIVMAVQTKPAARKPAAKPVARKSAAKPAARKPAAKKRATAAKKPATRKAPAATSPQAA